MKASDLIIGRQPLVEALQAGRAIDKILFQRNVSGESIGEIRKLAEKRGIPIQQVPVEKMHSFTRANHQGVIALAALFTYMDLQMVIDEVVG
ncbi:MAG TPA: RNA methyltransferase substrate-binding domain-containing protein, partial [Puia sp.]